MSYSFSLEGIHSEQRQSILYYTFNLKNFVIIFKKNVYFLELIFLISRMSICYQPWKCISELFRSTIPSQRKVFSYLSFENIVFQHQVARSRRRMRSYIQLVGYGCESCSIRHHYVTRYNFKLRFWARYCN